VKGRPSAIALSLCVLVAAGCGGDGDDDLDLPIAAVLSTDVVAEAASRTFDEPTLEIALTATSKTGDWQAAGLVEPAQGRYRVELPSTERPATIHAVVGLDGEGIEATVSEGPFPGPDDQICWFNPHAPVGSFLGTASVEESVRIVGATLESLRGEIARARAVGDGAYAVELRPSAARPKDDFRKSPERIWGDRNLFEQLARPIVVTVADDRIVGVVIELRDYRPYYLEGPGFGPDRIDSVVIDAQLNPTESELVLEHPGCGGLE
jgi:hypothetical protein